MKLSRRSLERIICGSFFTLTLTVTGFSQSKNGDDVVKHPVYWTGGLDVKALQQSVSSLMEMSVKDVIAEVPEASGICFIGCPNCHGGAEEYKVFRWEPGMGDKVRCNYCGMEFPNAQFPNNGEKVIIAPSGVKQIYRYYEDSTGYPYYFEAHAWYGRWSWIRSMAEKLAQLWYVTKDNAYGDRAAAIAGRFAQVFPDYAIRFDYPHKPVLFFPANQKWPYEGLTPYRGAKWSWWAYMDIPTYLANVYDLLMSGYDWNRMNRWIGPETEKKIVRNLLRLGYEFTTGNPETYTNMSPGMYADIVRLGRILGDPSMVHDAVSRFRVFISKGFLADGWWKEGTVSYHDQTINLLKNVTLALEGYADPVDWKGERLEGLDLVREVPLYGKALLVSQEAILPNGRKIPINDTWSFDRTRQTDTTFSRLWPALGNAALGVGSGENQVMLNINWSGNYGHSHFDNGSVILFAMGQELLSDIGYTHSKYGGWSVSTASHNTVVIDQKDQEYGTMNKPVTGRLTYYDDQDTHVKCIDIDASPAYPNASLYRRRLILVHVGAGMDYLIDRFDVRGGGVHDWFLHGMCEEEGHLQTSLSIKNPVKDIVPEWGGKEKPKTQYERDPKRFHPYSYLSEIQKGMTTSSWDVTWRYKTSALKCHIFSQPETEVFRFRSPSVRLANEDDNKVDDFYRNGIMQRHAGGTSTFIAVYEPFGNAPWIKSVNMEDSTIVLTYVMDNKKIIDRISLSDDRGIIVASGAGWRYETGEAISGEVRALHNHKGKWQLLIDREVPAVSYVRLEFSDRNTYYWPVSAVHHNVLELEGDPGFALDEKGNIQFHTFPYSQYDAPLRYTVFAKKQR